MMWGSGCRGVQAEPQGVGSGGQGCSAWRTQDDVGSMRLGVCAARRWGHGHIGCACSGCALQVCVSYDDWRLKGLRACVLWEHAADA